MMAGRKHQNAIDLRPETLDLVRAAVFSFWRGAFLNPLSPIGTAASSTPAVSAVANCQCSTATPQRHAVFADSPRASSSRSTVDRRCNSASSTASGR